VPHLKRSTREGHAPGVAKRLECGAFRRFGAGFLKGPPNPAASCLAKRLACGVPRRVWADFASGPDLAAVATHFRISRGGCLGYGSRMVENQPPAGMSFAGRIGLAFRLLFDGPAAGRAAAVLHAPAPASAPKPASAPVLPPERVHASGLLLLTGLQREGRLVDFLEQDVAGFSDEEVGAAARVVHGGCRKALRQYLELAPASPQAEGEIVTLPAGFDAERFRLTGNVAGQPPFRGALKHHGWVVREIRLPAVNESLDPRVIAPAEVELP